MAKGRRFRGTMRAMVDLIQKDLEKCPGVPRPENIARWMWSQFTGTILLNETLLSVEPSFRRSIHDELDLWIKTFLAGLLKQ